MAAPRADLVLTGGRVRTPAHPSGFAQALAVRAGVIQALGTDDDVRDLVGPGSRVIDLRASLRQNETGCYFSVLPSWHVRADAGGFA